MRRTRTTLATFGAIVALLGSLSGQPTAAATAQTGATEVSILNVDRGGHLPASDPALGPYFYVLADDADGLSRVTARWCRDDDADDCIAPVWEAEAEGTTSTGFVKVTADFPLDAHLGDYTLTEVTFLDDDGQTTSLLPGGVIRVDGVVVPTTHSFDLTSTVTVIDERAPAVLDAHWSDDVDWAVEGSNQTVSMDVHLTDNWHGAVKVRVHLEGPGNNGFLFLNGVLPERGSGAQDGWVRATGTLGDGDRPTTVLRVESIQVTDARGNYSLYRPDGALFLKEYAPLPVESQHTMDFSGLRLHVRSAKPGILWPVPVADSTLALEWIPAVAADGSLPRQYTVHLVPLSPLHPSGRAWGPSDLPERVKTLGGAETSTTIAGLDNGRLYEITVVAHFPEVEVASTTIRSSPWPSVTYSPTVSVIEGDVGDSTAVVTARLSSPALVDMHQFVSVLRRGATASEDDYREELTGSLSVAAGTTTATVSLPIVGDTREEDDETFTLFRHFIYDSSEEQGSNITVITILDDDPQQGAPLSIGSTEVPGAGEGSTDAVVTVRLARPHREPVSVRYRTIDRSGVAGRDYAPRDGVLRFRPGQVSKTVRLRVLESADERDVSFVVRLSDPRGAKVARPTGRVVVNRSLGRR